MAENRAFMLRAPLLGRRLPDRSSVPRLRAIEDQLGQLPTAPDPDPVFRSELRAQLVAIAPRLVTEGSAAQGSAPGRHRAGAARTAPATPPDGRRRRFPVARAMQVATALVVVCALLLGGAWWLSRDTLPGDNLYGLKRAGERVQLTLAGGGADHAQDQLKFSQKRIAEVLALWQHGQPPTKGDQQRAQVDVDAQTAALIKDTLVAANSELTAGASQLNGEAVQTKSSAPLQTLTTWASGQAKTLRKIHATMKPTGTKLLADVDNATALVEQASQRANGLGSTVSSDCRKHRERDQFGPLPCS